MNGVGKGSRATFSFLFCSLWSPGLVLALGREGALACGNQDPLGGAIVPSFSLRVSVLPTSQESRFPFLPSFFPRKAENRRAGTSFLGDAV